MCGRRLFAVLSAQRRREVSHPSIVRFVGLSQRDDELLLLMEVRLAGAIWRQLSAARDDDDDGAVCAGRPALRCAEKRRGARIADRATPADRRRSGRSI